MLIFDFDKESFLKILTVTLTELKLGLLLSY